MMKGENTAVWTLKYIEFAQYKTTVLSYNLYTILTRFMVVERLRLHLFTKFRRKFFD